MFFYDIVAGSHKDSDAGSLASLQQLHVNLQYLNQLSSEDRNRQIAALKKLLNENKQATVLNVTTFNADLLEELVEVVEQCPYVTFFQRKADEKSPILDKLSSLAARNAYLWLTDPTCIVEEETPFNEVDWWDKAASFWISQAGLSLDEERTFYYYCLFSFSSPEAYQTRNSFSVKNLCIEQMGIPFLKACLNRMQRSELPNCTFVLNTDSRYRDDQGSLLRNDHLSVDYLGVLTESISKLPFKKLVLEGICPERTHTLSSENWESIRENFAGCSALEIAHVDAAFEAQKRTKADVSTYHQNFFEHFKKVLLQASSELEIVIVRSIVEYEEEDENGNRKKDKIRVFSEAQLNELINWVEENKITTYIEDAHLEAYEPAQKKLLQKLETCIAKNRWLYPKKSLLPKKETAISHLEPIIRKKRHRTRERHFHLHLEQEQQLNLQLEQERQQEQQEAAVEKAVNTEKCLDLKKFLKRRYFRKRYHLFGNGNQLDTWYSLFGRYRESFEDFYVSPHALQEIFIHFTLFDEGFPFHDLPQGFFLAPGKPCGEVLCFDPARPPSLTASPLTLKPTKQRSLEVTLRGDLEQFDIPNDNRLETLFSEPAHFEQDKNYFFQALNAVVSEEKMDVSELKNLEENLNTLLVTPKNGRALFYLLQHTSIVDIQRLIDSFPKNSPQKEFFKNYFLDTTENWVAFLDPSYQATFRKMEAANFHSHEWEWWYTLATQHMQHQPGANLDNLWDAFVYFTEAFKRITKSKNLPAHCPFDNVKNMQTRLKAFLCFLEKHPHPEDSEKEWPLLDFTPTGFLYALLPKQGYERISSEMALTPPSFSEEQTYFGWKRNTVFFVGNREEIEKIRNAVKSDSFSIYDFLYFDKGTLHFYALPQKGPIAIIDQQQFENTLQKIRNTLEKHRWFQRGQYVADHIPVESFILTQAQLHQFILPHLATAYPEKMRQPGDVEVTIGQLTTSWKGEDRTSHSAPTAITPLSYQVSFDDLSKAALNEEKKWEDMVLLFYRYLGQQHWVANLKEYREAIRVFEASDIFLKANFSLSQQKKMLLWLASFTTGPRASQLFQATHFARCIDLACREKEAFEKAFQEWHRAIPKPSLQEFSQLVYLQAENANNQAFLKEIHSIYGSDFLSALFLIEQSDFRFIEKIKTVHSSALSLDAKKLLMKPAFLGMNDFNREGLLSALQQDDSLAVEWAIISQMQIDWEHTSQPDTPWISILNSLKNKQYQEKEAIIRKYLNSPLSFIEEKEEEVPITSFEVWKNQFLKRFDTKTPSQEGRIALECVDYLENLNLQQSMKKELLKLLTLHAKTVDQWSVYVLQTILASLKKIETGPPSQRYPLSLLSALIEDPFWKKNKLSFDLQNEWADKISSILKKPITKKEKKARLAIALRQLASHSGQEEKEEAPKFDLDSCPAPILENLANIAKKTQQDSYALLFKNTARLLQEFPEEAALWMQAASVNAIAYCAQLNAFLSVQDKEKRKIIIRINASMIQLQPEHVGALDNLNDDNILLRKIERLASLNLLPVETFIHHLSQNEQKQLLDYLNNQEKNPHGELSIDDNFSEIRVVEVIDMIEALSVYGPQRLSYAERLELIKQITFVNEIGYKKFIPCGNEMYPPTKDMSLDQLHAVIEYYKKIILNEEKSSSAKLTARLILLAAARQLMQKTTETMPNSTQLISILYRMMKNGNLFSQLIAGEGKSFVLALDAALVALEENAVDICTANDTLAQRDLKNFDTFFKSMGVAHGHLTATSELENYQPNTVYYSHTGQRILFEGRLATEGKQLFPRVLRLDEADQATLDDPTRYRHTLNLRNVDEVVQDNQTTWIYTAINQFIDDQAIAVDDVISDEDVELLKNTLRLSVEKNNGLLNQLKAISDAQWKQWLCSAQSTLDLQEDRDYICGITYRSIDEERVPYSMAYIIVPKTNRAVRGPQWSEGIHQFLLDRLNRKYAQEISSDERPPFIIDPEIHILAALGVKNFVDRFDSFWAVTGTLGSVEEMLELARKYGAAVCRMPTHLKNNLYIKASILTDHNGLKTSILTYVKEALNERPSRPVLIHAKTISQSEEITAFLKENLSEEEQKRLQQCHAKNIVDEIDETKKIAQAGEDGWITVSTLFNRGTDIDTRHAQGLLSIYTDPDDLRECEQAFRRSGRYGLRGDAVLIVDQTKLRAQHHVEAFPPSIETHRAILLREKSLKRQIREREDAVRNYLFQWYITCNNAIPDEARNVLKDGPHGLDMAWSRCLGDLEKDFRSLMEKKPPNDVSSSEKVETWLSSITKLHIGKAIILWNTAWDHFVHSAQENQWTILIENKMLTFKKAEQEEKDEKVSSVAAKILLFIQEENFSSEIDEKNPVLGELLSTRDYTIPVSRIFSEKWYEQFIQAIDPDEKKDTEYVNKMALKKLFELEAEDFTIDDLPRLGSVQKREPSEKYRLWKEAAELIAETSNDTKTKYLEAHVHHVKGCMEEYIRTKGEVGKEALLDDSLEALQESEVYGAFSIIDNETRKKLEKESWDNAIKFTSTLLDKYNTCWFKSFDRKNNVLGLRQKLKNLSKGQPDWPNLLTAIENAKKELFASDLNYDRWFFWLKKRNYKNSRYLSALDQASKIAQANTKLATTLTFNNNNRLPSSLLEKEYEFLENTIQALLKRGEWYNDKAFLDKISYYRPKSQANDAKKEESKNDTPNYELYYQDLKIFKQILENTAKDPSKQKQDMRHMLQQTIHACERVISGFPYLNEEIHRKNSIVMGITEALSIVSSEKFSSLPPLEQKAKKLAEIKFSIEKAWHSSSVTVITEDNTTYSIMMENRHYKVTISNGKPEWPLVDSPEANNKPSFP